LAGDTARAATSGEEKDLRREATALKEVVADLTLENRLLKKARAGMVSAFSDAGYLMPRPPERNFSPRPARRGRIAEVGARPLHRLPCAGYHRAFLAVLSFPVGPIFKASEPADRGMADIVGPSDVDQCLSGFPSRNGFLALVVGQFRLAAHDDALGLCALPALAGAAAAPASRPPRTIKLWNRQRVPHERRAARGWHKPYTRNVPRSAMQLPSARSAASLLVKGPIRATPRGSLRGRR